MMQLSNIYKLFTWISIISHFPKFELLLCIVFSKNDNSVIVHHDSRNNCKEWARIHLMMHKFSIREDILVIISCRSFYNLTRTPYRHSRYKIIPLGHPISTTGWSSPNSSNNRSSLYYKEFSHLQRLIYQQVSPWLGGLQRLTLAWPIIFLSC